MTNLFPEGFPLLEILPEGAVSGGTVTTTPEGVVHTFTSSSLIVLTRPVTVEYVLVGGGGGGGFAGGGGGEVKVGNLRLPAGSHNVIIGAGGAGTTSAGALASNGGNSSIGEFVVALGGGGGGHTVAPPGKTIGSGSDGGNGGGGSVGGSPPTPSPPGVSLVPGGFSGGFAAVSGSATYASGSGGGAGQTGENSSIISGPRGQGGKGGNGRLVTIRGIPEYFGGGGGGSAANGSADTRGAGGLGGGGMGGRWHHTTGATLNQPTAGGVNTGGGGGGCAGAAPISAPGGSGIVIIRYKPIVGLSRHARDSILELAPEIVWDLDRIGSTWQDEEATVLAFNEGDPVRMVKDLSGNGHHLIITDGVLRRDALGSNYVYFNGMSSLGETSPIEWEEDTVTVVTALGKRNVSEENSVGIQFGVEDEDGSWRILTSSSTVEDSFTFASGGTVSSDIAEDGYASPARAVLTAISDIGSSSAVLRINGAQVGTASSLGSGAFGEYPITVGGPYSDSRPAHMTLGSTLIFKRVLDNTDTLIAESWVTSRTSTSSSGFPTLISPPDITTSTEWGVGATVTYTPGQWNNGVVTAWWTRGGIAYAPITSPTRILTEDDYATVVGIIEFVENSTGTLSTTANGEYIQPPSYLKMVGGTVTVSEEWVTHTFLDSGNLRIFDEALSEYLVVAGGGNGGAASGVARGGGGGAGQVLTNLGTPETLPLGYYPVRVGAGGASTGANGEDSFIGDLVHATGGGGGGTGSGAGATGGSGGGGGGATGSGTVSGGAANGPGTNAGGNGQNGSGNSRTSGGGGGASQPGSGIHGGAGITSDISGISANYAGGGGGTNGDVAGSATHGGGRAGISGTPGTPGTANTGGGGGGGASTSSGSAYAGGSGIIIIRYPFTGEM